MRGREGWATGFTLAELLIALAILGVIATFTIPKILTSQANAQKKAILKEGVATCHQVIYSLQQEGTLQAQSHAGGTTSPVSSIPIAARFNSVKILSSTLGSSTVLLANGSTINIHIGNVVDCMVDYNGSDGPNAYGDDRVAVYWNDQYGNYGNLGINRIGPSNTVPAGMTAENTALHDALFQ